MPYRHSSEIKGVQHYLEPRLVRKNRHVEGFYLADPSDTPEHVKYFTDSRYKLLLDNTSPYGHFLTGWLYTLLNELERAQEPSNTLILVFLPPKSPDLVLEHMSTVTAFVVERLLKKGYQVEYIEAEAFYVSNFVHFEMPLHVSDLLLPPVVGRFLAEDITTSSYGRKIYLSRSKTTTSNSRILSRIDDEQKLEDYLVSLGFEVLIPEQYSSYQEQLNVIASAKILASITSSALYSALVLPPTSKIVEIATLVHVGEDLDLTNAWFPEHYRFIAHIQGNMYLPIPNPNFKADDVIAYIENNPEIKAILAS